MTNKIMREGGDSVEATTSRTAAENESHSQEAEHSPLPWRVRHGVCRIDHPDTSADVHGRDGQFVADCGCHDQANANARLIVRCVNSHDDLLAALKAVVGSWVWDDYRSSFSIAALLEDAEKAIAKAEGR